MHRNSAFRCGVACLLTMLLAVGLLTSTGCWKSTASATKEELEKLKKKPERPFEPLRVFTEPNERSSFDENAKDTQRIMLATKPSHWTGVLVQARANQFDFEGRLESTPQNSQQQPVDLERSTFWVMTERGITLPKGQRKAVETLFFPPRPDVNAAALGSTWIANELRSTAGSEGLEAVPELVAHMPSYQYFMVVLAQHPARYTYLNDLPCVRPPTEFTPVNVLDANYLRVLYPPVDQPLALSTQSLCWTSIACLVWDDVLAGALLPEQQQAMLDWLHWGGRLIVSGPDSLDKLQGTFLAPYLPVRGVTAGVIDPARLLAVHQAWSVRGDNSQPLGSRAGESWSGIEFATQPGAEYLPGTSDLVAQRPVGRGRIVVTGFRLSEPDLISWPSFDGFFNACLLGRPARSFTGTRGFEYVGKDAPEVLDPAVVTGMRFLTRDAAAPRDSETVEPTEELALDLNGQPLQANPYLAIDQIDQLKADPGTAAWNDFSWISNTARQTLQNAAGISVPRRQFVLKMIGLYLLIIVPVNWLVFRLLGRVEWAWIAVPLVAVVWGVLVVWLAQLDIGFARAQIEVDVLEMQPAYSRGHLTRYTALYSSLSSEYDLRYDDPSAVALPFSSDRVRLSGQGSAEVTLTTIGERDLGGYPVSSNSTGMVHAEQMYESGTGIVWHDEEGQPPTVTNGTQLKLSGAVVIRRQNGPGGDPIDEIAWLGDLEPGTTAGVSFFTGRKELQKQRDTQAMTANQPAEGQLTLHRLLQCVQDHKTLEDGEVRLVAWREGALEGIQVRPETAQSRAATLIVAHLKYGPAAVPTRDENLRPLSAFRLDRF